MKLIIELKKLIIHDHRLIKSDIEYALQTYLSNKARAATPELIMKEYYPLNHKYFVANQKCKSHEYNFGNNLIWRPHQKGVEMDMDGDLYICTKCGCDVKF